MVPLFLDDCLDARTVARQLRAAGHPVYMARELGLKGQDDETQIRTTTELGAVLATQNQGDFARRHRGWQAAGRPHAGILLTRRRLPVGSKLERLERAARLLSPEAASNQLMALDYFRSEEAGLTFVASLAPPGS